MPRYATGTLSRRCRMQLSPKAQSHQLEAIANGTSPWDESAFGKLVSDNAEAVETMVRGTSLPYCAWGLDFQLGAATPIPQIPRGRALARLNVLTAQRLAAQGNSRAATLHLLAGIRFAQDLSQDMSLIGVLTGKLALASDLNAAAALAQSNQLSKSDREKLALRGSSLTAGRFRLEPIDTERIWGHSGCARTTGAGEGSRTISSKMGSKL